MRHIIEFERGKTSFVYFDVRQICRRRAATLRRRGEFVIKVGSLRYWDASACACSSIEEPPCP